MNSLPMLGAAARLYLRPIWFADTPVGQDGRTVRIGNSLIWFQGVEAVVRDGGQRLWRDSIAIDAVEDWIGSLPGHLAVAARQQMTAIAAPRAPLTLGDRTIRLDLPQLMGILNMTPDSFSDGGKHVGDPAAAADSGFAMHAAGAAIIDVGGESTRPGAATVWEGDEIARVVPAIERLAKSGVVISIDTRKAAVMEAALAAGAHIVNDVSALLHDPRSMEVVARAGCPVILMHAPSTGDDPHQGDGYGDVVADIFDWLSARIDACVAAGVARDRIIVDPGIGFGKSLADNLAISNRLTTFHALGVPVLYGASRKRMIGALSNQAPVDQRLGGSVMIAAEAARQGAQIVRVHDVPETVQAFHVWRGLRDAALVAG